jgi:ferredoxin
VVGEPFGQATGTCIACGACAAVCPVGAIELRVDEEARVAELLPWKARVELAPCAECGKRTVTPPVAAATAAKLTLEWGELKALARLCPECRRKHAAASLGTVASRASAAETVRKEP